MKEFKELLKEAKDEGIAQSAISLCKLLGYNSQWYKSWDNNPTGQRLQAQKRFLITFNLLLENKKLKEEG